MGNQPRRILIIKLGALGDLFLATDAFHAIRRHHPHDRIVILTRPAYAELAADMPWFDEVLKDPSPRLWQLNHLVAFRKILRGHGFHRVYDLQCNQRTGYYFWMLWPSQPEWVGHVLGCSHPRPAFVGQSLPTTERLLRQIAAAGVQPAGPGPISWLTGSTAEFHLPERFVVLVPGCSPHRPGKRWPAAKYAKLAHELKLLRLGVVIVGTTADTGPVASITEAFPDAVNLTGRTSFGQLAEVARRARAVIGNDTGPVHIMASTNTPTLVLMSGESNPVTMRPNGANAVCLQANLLDDLPVASVLEAFAAIAPIGSV